MNPTSWVPIKLNFFIHGTICRYVQAWVFVFLHNTFSVFFIKPKIPFFYQISDFYFLVPSFFVFNFSNFFFTVAYQNNIYLLTFFIMTFSKHQMFPIFVSNGFVDKKSVRFDRILSEKWINFLTSKTRLPPISDKCQTKRIQAFFLHSIW